MSFCRGKAGEIVQSFLIACCGRSPPLRCHLLRTGSTPCELYKMIADNPPFEVKLRDVVVLHSCRLSTTGRRGSRSCRSSTDPMAFLIARATTSGRPPASLPRSHTRPSLDPAHPGSTCSASRHSSAAHARQPAGSHEGAVRSSRAGHLHWGTEMGGTVGDTRDFSCQIII